MVKHVLNVYSITATFLKSLPLFRLFSSLYYSNLNQNWIKWGWCAWVSNLGLQNGWCRQNYWAALTTTTTYLLGRYCCSSPYTKEVLSSSYFKYLPNQKDCHVFNNRSPGQLLLHSWMRGRLWYKKTGFESSHQQLLLCLLLTACRQDIK